MTLRLRIFLFNLISVFLATFVVALVGVKIVESTVVDGTFQRLGQIRINKSTLIENYFAGLEAAIVQISSNALTDDLLLSPPHANIYLKFRSLLDNYAKETNIYDLILVNSQGEVVYSTRKDLKQGSSVTANSPKDNNVKKAFLWARTQQNQASQFFDFQKEPFNPKISSGIFVAPIFHDEKMLGVLIIKVSVFEIDRLIHQTSDLFSNGMKKTGETLIYGSNWTLRNTGHQLKESATLQKGKEKKYQYIGDENIVKVENNKEIQELGTDYRGKKVFRSISKIYLPSGHQWYIQTKIDKDEAFAILNDIAIASGIAGVLIFILFLVLTFAVTGKIMEPIQLLSDRLEKLGTNNLTQKINYASNDEIGLLVNKYNQLADRLEMTMVSKEFLDSVIQSISAFLFIVKVRHHNDCGQCSYIITQTNESAEKFFQLSSRLTSEIDLKDLIIAQPEFQDYRWLLKNHQSIQAEVINSDRQSIPVLINWSLLPKRGGEDLTFVFVCTDIKDRMAAEKALIEAREQAETASMAKSDFLACMSHEIHTPLNAIIGMTDILAESKLKSEQKQMVRICKNAGENLLTLVNDILDMSKIEAREIRLEKIIFDLEATVRDICEIFKQKAKERNLLFTIDVNIGSESPHLIMGDPTRLRQILFNLIGNALKFTETGEISVKLEFNEDEKKYLRFEVKDTGVGIPEDKQSLLFQSFAQADSSITRKYGGSGLGLAISKNLVELMSGRIWFDSKQDKGSTFYFVIPFMPATCPIVETSTVVPVDNESVFKSNRRDAFRKPKIMIVDDTEDNRFLMLKYLDNLSVDIVQTGNGLEAVETVLSDAIDLILMDIQMPIMDGCEATKKIRIWEQEKKQPLIPIIAISANAMPEDIKKSLDVGCTEHLTKPIKRSSLVKALQKYICLEKI